MRFRARHVAAGVAGVVAMATFAGPASATHPNDRGGMLGVGAVAAGTDRVSIRPDDRGIARGPGSLTVTSRSEAVRPDDRGGARGPGAASVPATAPAAAIDVDGFPWTTVSMAAVVLALVGVLGAALVLNGRYHRRPA